MTLWRFFAVCLLVSVTPGCSSPNSRDRDHETREEIHDLWKQINSLNHHVNRLRGDAYRPRFSKHVKKCGECFRRSGERDEPSPLCEEGCRLLRQDIAEKGHEP